MLWSAGTLTQSSRPEFKQSVLVLELIPRVYTLGQLIEERPGFIAIGAVKMFMRQLLSGLEHCHQHKVTHRDVKV